MMGWCKIRRGSQGWVRNGSVLRGMARSDTAWPGRRGWPRMGEVGYGVIGHWLDAIRRGLAVKVRKDTALPGKTGSGWTRKGRLRQGLARQANSRHGRVGFGSVFTRSGCDWYGRARQARSVSAALDGVGQRGARHGMAGQVR
jgi:hypothetical protein